jgi:hypothetical protein
VDHDKVIYLCGDYRDKKKASEILVRGREHLGLELFKILVAATVADSDLGLDINVTPRSIEIAGHPPLWYSIIAGEDGFLLEQISGYPYTSTSVGGNTGDLLSLFKEHLLGWLDFMRSGDLPNLFDDIVRFNGAACETENHLRTLWNEFLETHGYHNLTDEADREVQSEKRAKKKFFNKFIKDKCWTSDLTGQQKKQIEKAWEWEKHQKTKQKEEEG